MKPEASAAALTVQACELRIAVLQADNAQILSRMWSREAPNLDDPKALYLNFHEESHLRGLVDIYRRRSAAQEKTS